jgi:hypothetical protein
MGSCLDPNRYQPVFANAAQRNAALMPRTGRLHGSNGDRPDTLGAESTGQDQMV